MKKFLLMATTIMLVACGGQTSDSGTKFAPKERTSSMTASQRQDAIAQKKSELDFNVETQLSPHSTRMAILPPAIKGDITESTCEKIILKMLQIASQNGISGMPGSSPIAFAMSLEPIDRAVTGTMPQKTIIKYEVGYYVLNTTTGDIYGYTSEEITGVGPSFENATFEAVNELKSTPAIHKMIAEADSRIIKWFDENTTVIQNQVDVAIANKDFALALSYLSAVPESAPKAYAYVTKVQPNVLAKFKAQIAADELAAMKDAIAAAKTEYSPIIGAHLAMLPVGSPEAKEGAILYKQYLTRIDQQIEHEQRMELEQLEMEKLQMQYEAEATAKAANTTNTESSTSNSGSIFGGKVKSFFSGASVMSMVLHVLGRCLWIL